MTSPAEVELTYDTTKSVDSSGACREFWMRFPGLTAAADCDAPSVIYYLENPFYEDMVVLTALAVITTLDAQDADIDVGLADDAAGTDTLSLTAAIFDSIVNTAAGVFEGTIPQAVAGTGSKVIWKANGTTTGAFLSILQNGDVDASALRWTLLLKVIPYKDLINTDVDTISV
jgi:hypothetical protein